MVATYALNALSDIVTECVDGSISKYKLWAHHNGQSSLMYVSSPFVTFLKTVKAYKIIAVNKGSAMSLLPLGESLTH